MSYVVTNKDRMAMINICEKAWNVDFKGSRERGEASYTRWDILAINPYDNMYYRTDGTSIAEAVENWFIKTNIRPEQTSTLYEAKALYVEEVIDEEIY